MHPRNWFRSFTANKPITRGTSTAPKRAARRRLGVETLEDRTVPTGVAAPSGLVSWWTGNNTAADVKGVHNGTLVGGATFAPGKVGQAFSFDGINDTVTLAGAFGGGPEATLEAWVKTTGTNSDLQAIISATESQFVHLQLASFGNNVAYTDGTTVGLPFIPQTPTDTWRHVAFTIKSGDSHLYVDGNLVGSSAVTYSTLSPTSTFRIGSGYTGARFFKGQIDEVAYYDRALNVDEVQSIYRAGSGGKVLSPIAADFPNAYEGPTGTNAPVTFTIRRTGSLAGSLTVN
jgi:hypothetical protein